MFGRILKVLLYFNLGGTNKIVCLICLLEVSENFIEIESLIE